MDEGSCSVEGPVGRNERPVLFLLAVWPPACTEGEEKLAPLVRSCVGPPVGFLTFPSLSPEDSSFSHKSMLPHKDRLCRLRTSDITWSMTWSMFWIRAPN